MIAHPDHQITVTGGGPFGRAWVDCSCGHTRTCASARAANTAALIHHHDVHGGCVCPPHVVEHPAHPTISGPGASRPADDAPIAASTNTTEH